MQGSSERGDEAYSRYVEFPSERQRSRVTPQLFFNNLLKLAAQMPKEVTDGHISDGEK